ncbi:MAG: glucosaminidase domain-containing protein [Candidatus Gastranaerophilales bacterium]|nr:glucosaminidase domain-containing protein [Candidatus Gastranaerophilales bacterium]
MFSFTPPHIHHCCPNPFGATMLNPKINFCLGMAAATSPMPMYGAPFGGSLFMPYMNTTIMPQMPAFGFGFNNTNYLNNYNALYNANFSSFTPTNNFGTNINSYIDLLTKQMQSSFKMPSFNFNFDTYLGETKTKAKNQTIELDSYNPETSKIKPGLLKGNLVGKEAVITELCKKYNVDVALVVTIIGQESGFGTSNLAQHNNFMGYRAAGDLGKSSKGFGYFSTPEKGLEAAIKNLSKYPERYASVKKADMNNIDAIGKIYCEGDSYASAIKNLYNTTVKNYLA